MSYQRLFNKAIYQKVNQENLDLLSDYTLELKANGKSEKTIYQYLADIRGFFCWVYTNANNQSVLGLKKRTFRKFFLDMMNNGSSTARINRLQSSIRNLLEFATIDDDEYDYDVNAMRSIKGLHLEKVREIVFLTDEQIDLLIKYLMDKKDYQKALFVSLSYDSCGRRNEIAQVKKFNFINNNQTNIVHGKRGKKFRLLYFNRTREIAIKYFEQRGNDGIDSLWITDFGERHQASSETLYSWVVSFREILKQLTGKDIPLTPHSFRHSGLEAYSNGTHHVLKELGKKELPLNVLKLIAHHTDISTTQSYLMNHDDDILAETFGIDIKED